MHGGIAHDALFADLFPSCLELRLDEADGVAVRIQKPRERGQNELERDERHVHRCEIQLIGDLLMREVAGVRALHTHHALVAAELPVELTVADVHGVDLFRAVLQHTVGEAAGRRADVGADAVRERDGKRLHRLFELESAAADIAQRVSAHLEHRVGGDRRAGLIDLLPVHIDDAAHDARLRLGARFGKAARNERDVQSFLCTHWQTSFAVRARLSASSPHWRYSSPTLPCSMNLRPRLQSMSLCGSRPSSARIAAMR